MKHFITRFFYFLIIAFLFLIILVFLPFTPRQKDSLYFSSIDKIQLLQTTKTPRIIFVGGSNLSFGLNSQIFADSLKINPINTAIHAHIGLIYMLDQIYNHIKSGDIIIIVPEYNQFYDDFAYGGEELLITATSESPFNLFTLRLEQINNIIKYIPSLIGKLNISDYLFYKPSNDDVYSKRSFNKYGDAFKHWELSNRTVSSSSNFGKKINLKIKDELLNFNSRILKKGAMCYLSFPSIQEKTYLLSKKQIIEVELEMQKTQIPIISKSYDYSFSDDYIFNSVYHMNKIGVQKRTITLLNDFIKKK